MIRRLAALTSKLLFGWALLLGLVGFVVADWIRRKVPLF